LIRPRGGDRRGNLLRVVESSIPAVLRERASLRPDDTAFTFIDYEQDWAGVAESLTWSQQYRRASNVARELKLSGSVGDRALILAPHGLDYISAFLGALQAGFIAVPLSVPLGGVSDERVSSVLRDASPAVVLTTSTVVGTVADYVESQCADSNPSIVELDLLALDSATESGTGCESLPRTAYLQYTSGSTREPAGVMVSHKSVLANFEQLVSNYFVEYGEVAPPDCTALSWLPFYHDMGLLLGIVFPILSGNRSVLSSPASFLQRPARWMQLLASNGRVFSAAPNFAFELAARKTSDDDLAGLDLGDVLSILNGSERVQPATLRRFAERFAPFNLHAKALRPSYGLAEATLYVAAREPGQGPQTVHFESEELTAGLAKRCANGTGVPLVSYGRPRSPIVRIVDPEDRTECPAGTVGEIWVHGDNVALGYWRKPRETETTFAATLVAPADGAPEKPWLRTGDLGFFSGGELFIIGRIKDLLIVYGRNHSPDDIEATVQEITRGRVAAISVPDENGENLIVIIEQKKPSDSSDQEFTHQLDVVKRQVTAALSHSHGLRVADLVPVQPGSIPVTTSGKVRRSACVEQYRRGQFARLDDSRPHADTAGAEWLRAQLAGQPVEQQLQTLTMLVRTATATVLAHPDPTALDADTVFVELGFDSVNAVELRDALAQSTGLMLPPTIIFDQPSPAALARHLATLLTDVATQAVSITRPAGCIDEPVAVVGMACRFPGDVDSAAALWDLVNDAREAVGAFPSDRGWDLGELFDADPDAVGRTYVRAGAFLSEAGGFDAEFFGISAREAATMDPQQRVLLEVCWEALETAGIDPAGLVGSDTGVFVGAWSQPGGAAGSDGLEGYALTGLAASVASGRVAYVLGSQGPAITVDTACSSSLVATHLACQSLRNGESALALAGGVTVMTTPWMFIEFARQRGLAADGRCKAFAAAADGTGWGEGAGVLVLERLSDARRNNHPVLAIVAGSAVNQDGASNGLTAPNGLAQQRVIRQAAANAGIELDQVDVVEAHGTGTTLGDPIEAAALLATYGANRDAEHPLWLGSIKSNIGHTQAAAGVAGMIKMIQALNHHTLPPTLHADHPSPHIDWSTGTLRLLTEPTPWPATAHPRTGAVSSFGISGTNAHVIIRQAPETAEHDGAPAGSAMAGSLLFPLSSTSAEALRQTAGRLADWVQAHDEVALPDLAYTLARRRAHRPVRTVVVAGSRPQLAASLREVADGDAPYVPAVGRGDRGAVWVFSGQGSQWAAMGAQLLATEPVFAATVAQVEPLIARESGFSVTEALAAPEVVTGQLRIQPTLFTMQVALAATMTAYGARAGAVIGHSLGEAAAAVVAGALSLEDGVRVICRRSQLMSRIAGVGATASVELPARQVLSELAARGINDVVVAVVASPQSSVIAGATQTVRELVTAWERRDVMAREVPADVAFHSPQVDPILEELTHVLMELQPTAPEVPYYSATLIDPREQPVCDAGYWADNLRYAVRFGAAVQAALEDGYRVFAELSPHPLLTHAVGQTARSLDVPAATLAGMHREQALPSGLRGFVADLHSAGAAVDFSVLFPSGRLVDAPLSTWTHRRLPVGPNGNGSQARGDSTVSVHPLLGAHVRLPEEPERHVWQSEVGTGAQPWLADHQIHDVAALPRAAYCEMALAAARAVLGEAAEVRDVRFEQTLLLDDDATVFAVASVASPGILDFVVETDQVGERVRSATAVLHAAEDEDEPPARDIGALKAAHPRRMEGTELRQWFDKRGIRFGPALRGLAAARTAVGTVSTVLAEVRLPSAIGSRAASYGIHPALLDACFQSVAAHPAVQRAGSGGLLLPLGVRRLRAHVPTHTARYCYTTVIGADGDGVEADLEVLDKHGTVLLVARGLQLGTGVSENARLLDERLLTIRWQQNELPGVVRADPGAWLLISTSTTAEVVATHVADTLKLSGAQCTSVSWAQHGDHLVEVERLRHCLGPNRFAGAVVCTGPPDGNPDEECALLGLQFVQHLARIARELSEASAEPARLYVVTSNAQTVVPGDRANLDQAGLRGLIRVVANEHPQLRATQIDIDDETDIEQLAQQLLGGSAEDETAWRQGQWYIARLYPAPLCPEERHTTVVNHEHDGMRLEIRAPGDYESMEFVARPRVTPGPGQIEVAVTASGVNFADVLFALGRYPGPEGRSSQLGSDFAGVVVSVGPGVTDHKVGDHVGGLSPNGCWATFIACDADLAVTLPARLADAQAAAVTTAHATAWYGLHALARIAPGDRVLIHSATRGVGQAAIAIARGAGAEIFATAGSEERRQLLHDMGIEHVYDSRSVEFAKLIRRDTDGYGVDIVLNTVTGVAQRAGVELLAFGGRFIELGKRDIYGDTRLGLLPFRRNLTFSSIDLGLLAATHPQKIRQLLETVYQLIADGGLPMPASAHFPLADAAKAIRVMGAAQRIGKLVLDVPRSGHRRVVLPPEQTRVFRPDGAYVITGGLGGLGLFLAERMAASGCGRIVLNSRSQPTLKGLNKIELIRAIGADVVVECGDIAQAETAQRLVAAATATGLPVRGVLHAAAVIEDATLTSVTDELIERVWAPKAYGAWHLHQATAMQPLDWFCSFSSAAALVGPPGQGAYAAANSWLDAFTKWRRAQGLPAMAIAWGPWSEIGRGTALAQDTGVAITPGEGAFVFETLLRHDRAYTGYAPIAGTPWLTAFAQHSTFAEVFKSTEQSSRGASIFLTELHALPPDEWPTRLRRLVSEQVGLILHRNLDPDCQLVEYGLNSLGYLELRTCIETETGIRVSPMDITTIRTLAEHLCDKLAPQRG
jgi:polyketide synthase 5